MSLLPVVDAFRLTKYTAEGPKKTNWVKVTFQGSNISKEIKLNDVILILKEYVPPVKQYYNCYPHGQSSTSC